MIFLSYNHEDSCLVEPIAVALRKIFGQDSIFYDGWSIQPGDHIVESMDKALEKCEVFFLFISKNSIDSGMVKLEWQSILHKATKGEIRLVPVRLDPFPVPTILSDLSWLDAFTNGMDITTRQIIDVASGQNIFRQKYDLQNNLNYTLNTEEDDSITIVVNAVYTIEPVSSYLIRLENSEKEVIIKVNKDEFYSGYNDVFEDAEGNKFGGWNYWWSEPTVPKFPVRFNIRSITSSQINFVGLYHRVSENDWNIVPPNV